MEEEKDARCKINQLLEQAEWRFDDTTLGRRNVFEENPLDSHDRKRPDYTLLDDTGKEIAVLEAKRPQKSPLDGKEQARHYAQRLNARFVILSNGEEHYLWDIESGHPTSIYDFPCLSTLTYSKKFYPQYERLADEPITADYILQSQQPNFERDPKYQNPATRDEYLDENNLKLLRPYQLSAIHALQKHARNRHTRFLFEMATGTGKTLIAAAVIKLFLRTGNAKRVLFLVDRIELENQAEEGFKSCLKKDFHVVIYKEARSDWKKAEIVVTTVQSLVKEHRYQEVFKPDDFDFVISDEAHRSINGIARKVFEYFIGFKLGLTATPKDYLKHAQANPDDPREWERRLLLDTYRAFGCGQGEPTFRYALLDGIRDQVLINPLAIDARTDITTQLLSEQGYAVILSDAPESEEVFTGRAFEKRLFNQATNETFCEIFLDNALRDPISGEIGKSLIFCVSQDHAQKIADILNKMASGRFPNQYQSSNFAVQVTSDIPGAAQFANDFKYNNLRGKSKFLPGYETSKTRVCVTVAMMTTGYDCPDLLNIGFMRPIFSPTDFVQMKGRGTRSFTFECQDGEKKGLKRKKERFYLFDFFANCEYFEEKFDYDKVLKLPKFSDKTGDGGGNADFTDDDDTGGANFGGIVILHEDDPLKSLQQTVIGQEGMKIDRQLFQQARQVIVADAEIKNAVAHRQWDDAVRAMQDKYEDKPNLFLTLEKIRRSEGLDRRITWREVLERVFGMTPTDRFLTKLEKLNADINQFLERYAPDSSMIPLIRDFISLYLTDERFRSIINHKNFNELHTYSGFSVENLKQLGSYREIIVEYIKTNISLNSYLD